MIKIDTGEKSGRLIVDGATDDLCLEMLAIIKMFYVSLKDQDEKMARSFKKILINNIADVLNMPFEEVEIYRDKKRK